MRRARTQKTSRPCQLSAQNHALNIQGARPKTANLGCNARKENMIVIVIAVYKSYSRLLSASLRISKESLRNYV